MMHEIKCPNCGQVFQIEESVFMDIARQVRDEEFDRELKQREALWNRQQQAAVQLARKEAEGELNQQLQKADMQIAQLRMELQSAKEKQQWETEKKLAQMEKQMMEKEARIAALQAAPCHRISGGPRRCQNSKSSGLASTNSAKWRFRQS